MPDQKNLLICLIIILSYVSKSLPLLIKTVLEHKYFVWNGFLLSIEPPDKFFRAYKQSERPTIQKQYQEYSKRWNHNQLWFYAL